MVLPILPKTSHSSRGLPPARKPALTAKTAPLPKNDAHSKALVPLKRSVDVVEDAVTRALHPSMRNNKEAKLAALAQLEKLGKGLVPAKPLQFWLAVERHRVRNGLTSEQLAKARIPELHGLYKKELGWMQQHLAKVLDEPPTTHVSGAKIEWLPQRAEKLHAQLSRMEERPFSMDELADASLDFALVIDVAKGYGDLKVAVKDIDDLRVVWKQLNRSRHFPVPFADAGTHPLEYFYTYRAVPGHPVGQITVPVRADRKDRGPVAFLAHDFVHTLDAVQADEAAYDGFRRSLGFDKAMDLPRLNPAHESYKTDAERYAEVKKRMLFLTEMKGWKEEQPDAKRRFADEAMLFELIHEQEEVPFDIAGLKSTIARELQKKCLLGKGTNLHFQLEGSLGKKRGEIISELLTELTQKLDALAKAESP